MASISGRFLIAFPFFSSLPRPDRQALNRMRQPGHVCKLKRFSGIDISAGVPAQPAGCPELSKLALHLSKSEQRQSALYQQGKKVVGDFSPGCRGMRNTADLALR